MLSFRPILLSAFGLRMASIATVLWIKWHFFTFKYENNEKPFKVSCLNKLSAKLQIDTKGTEGNLKKKKLILTRVFILNFLNTIYFFLNIRRDYCEKEEKLYWKKICCTFGLLSNLIFWSYRSFKLEEILEKKYSNLV